MEIFGFGLGWRVLEVNDYRETAMCRRFLEMALLDLSPIRLLSRCQFTFTLCVYVLIVSLQVRFCIPTGGYGQPTDITVPVPG